MVRLPTSTYSFVPSHPFLDHGVGLYMTMARSASCEGLEKNQTVGPPQKIHPAENLDPRGPSANPQLRWSPMIFLRSVIIETAIGISMESGQPVTLAIFTQCPHLHVLEPEIHCRHEHLRSRLLNTRSCKSCTIPLRPNSCMTQTSSSKLPEMPGTLMDEYEVDRRQDVLKTDRDSRDVERLTTNLQLRTRSRAVNSITTKLGNAESA
uniref:Uncharacterized protein n=2 Tax=Moniliophthora roreri TaxID=221103 RepID=A0A0W0G9F7_MONRR